ncbi:MAG: hypothetical protein GY830_00575 [Bacteroidetes bacterium]|nr:hypothetical protein [Bacteroidota bacterium]
MGRTLFTFSTGIVFGFAAGVFLDSKKRKKIQEITKAQIDRIKAYENTLNSNIDKIKGLARERKPLKTTKK